LGLEGWSEELCAFAQEEDERMWAAPQKWFLDEFFVASNTFSSSNSGIFLDKGCFGFHSGFFLLITTKARDSEENHPKTSRLPLQVPGYPRVCSELWPQLSWTYARFKERFFSRHCGQSDFLCDWVQA
jgi:hypothetical protein